MPLVKCPMCEKMISPNAESCPNCGEPMKKDKDDDKYSLILEEAGSKLFRLGFMIEEILDCNKDISEKIIKNAPSLLLEDLSLDDAKYYKNEFESIEAKVNIVPKEECYLEMKFITKKENEDDRKEDKSVIKCPNCKSEKVHKISGLSKVGSAAMFGVFSIGKLNKTYECDSCGYRW